MAGVPLRLFFYNIKQRRFLKIDSYCLNRDLVGTLANALAPLLGV
jgi:hypothetical protein